MRSGQVTALVLLLVVPLTGLALGTSVVLGGPVLRTGVERRAQAIALAGGHALAAGASPTSARRVAEAYAERVGVARSAVSVVATEDGIVVSLTVTTTSIRLPGASRRLRPDLVGIARAVPSMTQDDRPGAVLLAP